MLTNVTFPPNYGSQYTDWVNCTLSTGQRPRLQPGSTLCPTPENGDAMRHLKRDRPQEYRVTRLRELGIAAYTDRPPARPFSTLHYLPPGIS